MTELESLIIKVENAIRSMGVDPVLCRGEKVGQYTMVQGSATLWIDAFFSQQSNREYFQVMSPILSLANVANKTALYEELLTINDTLYNIAFTLFNNFVYLKNIREAVGLDESEIVSQIKRIGTYGDQYDDILRQKYDSTYQSGSAAGSPPQ